MSQTLNNTKHTSRLEICTVALLVLSVIVNLKQEGVEASNGIMFIASLMKIHALIQTLLGQGTDTNRKAHT